jgi:glycosyltransferase involved in cell wall biosynthesis
MGYDALTVPLYLPVYSDGEVDVKRTPVFFGGVNVYLQQKFSFFRRTPRWIDRMFDWRRLLRYVSKKAGMSSGEVLGETTLSMLQGEHGRQVKELERLVGFLAAGGRPDVIFLSNALLLGLVRRLKSSLSAPVICLLQDEDTFVDSMPAPYSRRCWEVMAERGGDVDLFVPVSSYYAAVMKERLKIPDEKIKVVRMGVDVSAYAPSPGPPPCPVIGFLSRQCDVKGLDTLVDAFLRVKSDSRLKNARLAVAGGRLSSDRAFVDSQMQKIAKSGCADDVEFPAVRSMEEKVRFLQGLSVMCVPERHGEACGLYVLEAAASGVPGVQPESGVFPELVRELEGGYLYRPNDVDALVQTLRRVLSDPGQLRQAGGRCRRNMEERFRIEDCVRRLAELGEMVSARY